jgi:hypothetical protein
MKCGFGLGSCNSEALYIATRKAGWQHFMNFGTLKMTKQWQKRKKTPCCEFHRKKLSETYPDQYTFRREGSPDGESPTPTTVLVTGPDEPGPSKDS